MGRDEVREPDCQEESTEDEDEDEDEEEDEDGAEDMEAFAIRCESRSIDCCKSSSCSANAQYALFNSLNTSGHSNCFP